ncbi:MAG: 50S ribosomal protein L5 [Chitinophagales bacterium]|nr:50S ribosomal protein L5 [Chitinophagales bacterium]
MSYVPRLKTKYKEEILSELMTKHQYKSIMQVPKITKIVVNQGVGAAVGDKKLIDNSIQELTSIVGQKAIATKAKKAISNFKLREDIAIGVKATLRGNNMYDFLDRLINIALPSVRDFKGVSDKSFDGRGNYSLGIKEHIVFPEINIDKINKISGLEITIVTTAKTDAEAYSLLSAIGIPFKKK